VTTDNTPDDTIAAAKQRLVAAKEQREKDRTEADRKFWQAVADEISSGNLRQVDAVEALGFNREYIRRNLKQLAETD
jgi:Holliday junction resolvasome RuvABC DNA-binding subunit